MSSKKNPYNLLAYGRTQHGGGVEDEDPVGQASQPHLRWEELSAVETQDLESRCHTQPPDHGQHCHQPTRV